MMWAVSWLADGAKAVFLRKQDKHWRSQRGRTMILKV